jgi:hypothetical protein
MITKPITKPSNALLAAVHTVGWHGQLVDRGSGAVRWTCAHVHASSEGARRCAGDELGRRDAEWEAANNLLVLNRSDIATITDKAREYAGSAGSVGGKVTWHLDHLHQFYFVAENVAHISKVMIGIATRDALLAQRLADRMVINPHPATLRASQAVFTDVTGEKES